MIHHIHCLVEKLNNYVVFTLFYRNTNFLVCSDEDPNSGRTRNYIIVDSLANPCLACLNPVCCKWNACCAPWTCLCSISSRFPCDIHDTLQCIFEWNTKHATTTIAGTLTIVYHSLPQPVQKIISGVFPATAACLQSATVTVRGSVTTAVTRLTAVVRPDSQV